MKQVFFTSVIAVTILQPAVPHAQTSTVNGTWQIEGLGEQPWSAVLRAEGSTLSGSVRTCASGGPPFPAAITDGTITGNRLQFTCTSPNGRKISFVGEVKGDEIALTYEHRGGTEDAALAPDVTGLFGRDSPRAFTAKRVLDGGSELAASVNLVRAGVKVEGALFLPRGIGRVRSVFVLSNSGTSWNGLAATVYADAEVRMLAAQLRLGLLLVRVTPIEAGPYMNFITNARSGSGTGLLQLLDRLATDSGHQEIRAAPLLFWGHSAAGPFGTTFALERPERTVAFVRYHSGERGIVGADIEALKGVPALFLQAGRDNLQLNALVEASWKRGRAIGAPWTFGLEPTATHQDPADVQRANTLLIPWLTAVTKMRLPEAGGTLRPVTTSGEGNWLPDEGSAQGWRSVTSTAK